MSMPPAQQHPEAEPPLERRTYTPRESAALLGISERLHRDLVQQGVIPVLRLGRRVLVRRATVERLLAEPEGAQAPIVELLQERRARGRQTKATAR